MNKSKKVIVSLLIALAGLFGYNQVQQASFGGGGFRAQNCDTASSTVVNITPNPASAQTILDSRGDRAWARIQLKNHATTTVFLSFDEGAAASIDNGLSLNATTTQFIDVGRSTDFVYNGEVTGWSSASTSVYVTDCRY